MQKYFGYSLIAFYLLSIPLKAQTLGTLTVEKIMRDPKKWIGTSPTDIAWSEDSKVIYFNWNPDKNLADSLYGYDLSSKKIKKTAPAERKTLPAQSAVFNKQKTQRLFEKNGDIFLTSTTDFKTRQLTSTVERESNPAFSGNDQKVIFTRGMNLYSITLDGGLLRQLTDFKTGTKKSDDKPEGQEKFLKNDQLAMFEVLKERKEKKDAGKKITDAEKAGYPKEIYLGEKNVSNQEISPGGQYIAYRLTQTNKSAKTTIVPNYVTESGFTEDIPARTKVGAPASGSEFWVYNVKKDTTAKVSVKDIPGISDKPDYLKDYPKLDTAWKNKVRDVVINGPFWSDNSKNAVVIVRSLDGKDRWVMALDPEALTLKLLDPARRSLDRRAWNWRLSGQFGRNRVPG